MTEPDKHYKYLNFLVMLYFTIMIITVVMIYKITQIDKIVVSASSLVIPFWYMLTDIIAEVYGYKVAKQLIWNALICQFVFIFTCAGLTLISSPLNSASEAAYNEIFLQLPRVFLGSATAVTLGAFINAYILTKWKILLRGKYFWLRSIGSTLVGEAFFVIIAFSVEFVGKIPLSQLLGLMLISYIIKLVFAPVLSIPATVACSFLKAKEGIDVYDYYTNFNPFKFSAKVTQSSQEEHRV